jgi:hypothetical protein
MCGEKWTLREEIINKSPVEQETLTFAHGFKGLCSLEAQNLFGKLGVCRQVRHVSHSVTIIRTQSAKKKNQSE